ncbi:putative DNA-binding domain-containing protein [Mitsuaria sp. WAJ17]|uniref:HvfC/BufC family peptide modification chaperone n=1 Tax=Mitsuaria sp. WAJ17 TaxID=2761452 RepID=UPI0016026437|nr:putative DNA-binding domain-containing protein [Mitsuaria sp. WAJ17]MBB2486410.1 putative DNA-binding domain-containing protein [Mitsuaria sp. WAJ17]
MSTEIERQAALLTALLQGDGGSLAALGLRGVLPTDAQAALRQGLQAYRGNAIALSERALAGAFPQLAGLLGSQFGSLAWSFWKVCPPACGDLGEWGAALPGFLRQSADDALADMAALEWSLHQAERAPDAALDAASLALLHGDPRQLRLVLRPGLLLLSVSDEALSLLASHRAWLHPVAAGMPAVLVWRKDWRGRATQLQAAEAAFMRSVLAGDSLETALMASQADENEGLDFTSFLQQALREQWLMAVLPVEAEDGKEDNNDEHPEAIPAPPGR